MRQDRYLETQDWLMGFQEQGSQGRGSLGEDWYSVLSGAKWWGEAGLVQDKD